MLTFKISKTSIYLAIQLFLLYHIVFIKFPYISIYTTIQRLAIIFLFIIILPYSIQCLKKTNLTIKSLLVFYIVIVLISSIINRNNMIITNTVVSGISYVLTIIELFVVFSTVREKRSIEFIVRVFLFFTIFYIVATDLLIFVNHDMFLGEYYLIGNKFNVGYKHLELIVLLLMKRNINLLKNRNNIFLNSILIISIISGIIFSYLVDSTTGIISIVILGLLLLLKDKLLYNSLFFVSILIGSSLVVIFINRLLTLGIVENFIVNVLHKNITLTGRTIIYDSIPKLIKGHLLFGYGYNTAYEVWTKYVSYMPNAQNGLINCVFEQGLIATSIMIILIKKIINKASKVKALYRIYKPIIALLYVYAIIATIEITIDLAFIGWVFLLYTSSLYNNSINSNIEVYKY